MKTFLTPVTQVVQLATPLPLSILQEHFPRASTLLSYPDFLSYHVFFPFDLYSWPSQN